MGNLINSQNITYVTQTLFKLLLYENLGGYQDKKNYEQKQNQVVSFSYSYSCRNRKQKTENRRKVDKGVI